MDTPYKDQLIQLVNDHALEIAPEGQPFILKSGAESTYYLDCRNLHLTPVALHKVVSSLWMMMQQVSIETKFNAFGGPSIGADPIVGGLCFMAAMSVNPNRYRGFMIRKESKDHGKAGRIVGPIKEGDKVVIIEDVVTSGGSSLDSIDCVEAFGCEVVHAFSVVDRLQGGAEKFEERGIPYTPMLTIEDLGIAP